MVHNNNYLKMVLGLPGHGKSIARRAEILRAIEEYTDLHGFAPGLRDVAEGAGMSTSNARMHLIVLKNAGLVSYQPGIPRSIVFLGDHAHDQETY